ncbi:hypothetical protein LWI28_004284 [Acer negundo]|uniref:WRKY domain-containing protein n=1 Tax=Acer negundo TaxID=4023 RepID=A0AAD5NI25_ACENE|nr:hypothetical protein LWI28_004284 [Acer negundo]KAK4837252.1 hypothetical protein QYF36_003961 [Acer negundo]
MENYNTVGDLEQNNNSLIIEELRQGRELARRLQLHLINLPCSSQETREMLVQKIISSYEKTLSMLMNSNSSTSTLVVPGGADHQQPAVGAAAAQPTYGAGLGVESPPLSGEDSDRDQELKDGSKKRKATNRSTHLVRVNPATGLEGTLDDGFSWRKYGQKDILGAKHPRGYYRCTHRLVQGCLATKQVQRSDEDPMILEITYRGRHTCTQASKTSNNPPEKQEQTNMTTSLLEYSQQALLQHGSGSGSSYQQQQQQHSEALLNLRRSLQVVTDQEPDHHHQNQVFSPAAFTGSSSGNYFSPVANNNFMSPATSGTANNNYFSNDSPSGIITTTFQGGSSSNQNFQSSDHQSQQPELMINVSAAASAANSPTVEADFPFGNNAAHEFVQHDSIFDNLGYFSHFHPFEK